MTAMACFGALRPMLSGDGLVVRLRLSCGEAPLALAAEIADWADRFGNGLIDLSARGNLQIRGVSDDYVALASAAETAARAAAGSGPISLTNARTAADAFATAPGLLSCR